jgi:single-strand DNA-binding protein
MEAQVHITGYAGTEVESRGNGTVSAFRLACTPRIKTKSGWSDGNTTWIEVACFRTLAQHVAQSVRKGDPVLVVGKLRTNVWEKDGQTHERLVLEADMVGHDLNRGTSTSTTTRLHRLTRDAGPTGGRSGRGWNEPGGAHCSGRASRTGRLRQSAPVCTGRCQGGLRGLRRVGPIRLADSAPTGDAPCQAGQLVAAGGASPLTYRLAYSERPAVPDE